MTNQTLIKNMFKVSKGGVDFKKKSETVPSHFVSKMCVNFGNNLYSRKRKLQLQPNCLLP